MGAALKKTNTEGISFFQKYLSVWVALCMAVGVLTEVPVMLTLVKIAGHTKAWFPSRAEQE